MLWFLFSVFRCCSSAAAVNSRQRRRVFLTPSPNPLLPPTPNKNKTNAASHRKPAECSAGAAPVKQLNVQGETPLTLEPPRCVMCPPGTYVPSPNRGNYGCVPCLEGATTPPGRFGMISTRFNGNGKDVCDC